MEVKLIEQEKTNVKLAVSGMINASNAPDFDHKLRSFIGEHPETALELDFKDADGISSAGLRVLLELQQFLEKTVSIVNVNRAIMDVFEDTGFTEFLNVSKVMRSVSIEGCTKLGRGYNGEVFQLDEGTIIKVFFPGYTLDAVRQEQYISRESLVAGLPTVISYDTVLVGERYGIVYEMLGTKTLSRTMAEDTEHFDEWVEKYAALYKKYHQTKANPKVFPKTKDIFHGFLNESADWYSEEELGQLHALVDAIPDSDTLIHGDFHPNNIMVQDGKLLTIDMGDVSCGHKAFDLLSTAASQANLVELAPEQAEFHTRMPAPLIKRGWKGLMDRYFSEYSDADRKRIDGQIRLLSKLKVACAPAVGKGAPKELLQASTDDARQNLIPRLGELIGHIDW